VLFNKHYLQPGQHAFLSPSKYSWINYDDEKLDRVYIAALAAQKGTELHKLAHDLIRLGVKLPRSKQTLSMYVNDAIGFRMKPEQILWYSENVFGTTDAISFRRNILRISDLKTGIMETSHHQLEVYAALFCLEYGIEYKFKPFDIQMELRIYQNDDVRLFEADPDVIAHIMDKIQTFDKRIKIIREETD
jgi:hypothetical protein